MHDLFTTPFLFINPYYRRSSITRKHLSSYVKRQRNFHHLTNSSQVPEGLQHHILVEILLGRVQQSPLFLSEVHMHIIIGHCILKYPIHMENKRCDTNNIVNAYSMIFQFWFFLHLFHDRDFIAPSRHHYRMKLNRKFTSVISSTFKWDSSCKKKSSPQ